LAANFRLFTLVYYHKQQFSRTSSFVFLPMSAAAEAPSSANQEKVCMDGTEVPPLPPPPPLVVAVDYSNSTCTTLDKRNGFEEFLQWSNLDRVLSYNEPPTFTIFWDRILGYGAYGQVYEGECEVKASGIRIRVAIKEMDPRFPDSVNFSQHWQNVPEVRLLPRLKHNHIVRLYGVFMNLAKQRVYLVYEFYPCTLREYLCRLSKQRHKFCTESRQRLLYQLLQAVVYLHRRELAHRDIKPGNLLLNPTTANLVLADFGSARLLRPAKYAASTLVLSPAVDDFQEIFKRNNRSNNNNHHNNNSNHSTHDSSTNFTENSTNTMNSSRTHRSSTSNSTNDGNLNKHNDDNNNNNSCSSASEEEPNNTNAIPTNLHDDQSSTNKMDATSPASPITEEYTLEVCSRWYRAPELMLGESNYTVSMDMWSVGCVFAELFTNQVLFRGSTEYDQLMSIFQILGTPNDLTRSADVPQYYGLGLAAVIPGLENEYGAFDLLSRMLDYDFHRRISAADALKHPYFKSLLGAEGNA
jgi:serine/threonine protein kinase